MIACGRHSVHSRSPPLKRLTHTQCQAAVGVGGRVGNASGGKSARSSRRARAIALWRSWPSKRWRSSWARSHAEREPGWAVTRGSGAGPGQLGRRPMASATGAIQSEPRPTTWVPGHLSCSLFPGRCPGLCLTLPRWGANTGQGTPLTFAVVSATAILPRGFPSTRQQLGMRQTAAPLRLPPRIGQGFSRAEVSAVNRPRPH